MVTYPPGVLFLTPGALLSTTGCTWNEKRYTGCCNACDLDTKRFCRRGAVDTPDFSCYTCFTHISLLTVHYTYESSRTFFTRETSPFTGVLMVVMRKNWQFFLI